MKDKGRTGARKGAVFVTLGVEVGGAVGVAAVLGYWVDDYIGTAPLFLIVLTLGASVAVFWRIWRILKLLETDGNKPS